MSFAIVMPQLGLTMEEGNVSGWLKKPGDVVKKNEPLFSVSTDKVEMDVESAVDGTLGKIIVPVGETVKVGRVKDYSAGLSRIIGNLTARYSLGFSLAEDERDDGRLHNLEVKVKAADSKGKIRKLEVSSRRGYYMYESGAKELKETTAAKTQ